MAFSGFIGQRQSKHVGERKRENRQKWPKIYLNPDRCTKALVYFIHALPDEPPKQSQPPHQHGYHLMGDPGQVQTALPIPRYRPCVFT